ncbi:palmitoleoyl-protein carboxylesterase notum1a isoform X1 [Solea solea]|uniref:palmitoleoyl-protein carboxylesterase notum1a isoform X1 n=1 Tax=Solea solea TaxID=90069 RepID=UPI00272CC85F|nr:palmitoleoyl-protein carboxylesterase notum1a isoform X1 [Solea solea]
MTAIRMVSSVLLVVLMQSGALCARRFRGGRNPQPRRAAPPPTYRADRGDTTESFPLDFTAVEENMDNFMTQVKNLAQSLYPCSAQKLDYDMKLNFLENTSVTCNDGSPAGYYLKESRGSRRWLIFLEGGWYCFNKENCDSRYETMRRLMSSSKWPQTKTGTGILSPLPEENPHWWNANMVFIPYCSSDVWSGAKAKTEQSKKWLTDKNHDILFLSVVIPYRAAFFVLFLGGYAFMGSLIIQEVVKDLLNKGLDNAKVLLLAGSSAGGTGVLLNVDRVAELLEGLGHTGIQVRGLSDSGWFLDNKQYHCTDCVDTVSCAPTETIKRGIKYWGGVVPERCRQTHQGEEWNCFFGYRVFPSIKSPVFVVQWLFDEAQLTVDNIQLTGQPVQEGQWRYIQNLGIELRNTLKDVPAMFAPACLSHEVITRNYWTDVQVKGTSLPRALHCWDRSLHDNRNNKAPPKGCPVHLIDSCPWPHCNPTCPTIRDQFTGQEMNVIQFLMHMGFDVQKMAQQQGMDPSKLLGMLSSGS